LSVTGRAVAVLASGNFLCGRITNLTMRCGTSAARGTEDSGRNEERVRDEIRLLSLLSRAEEDRRR